MVRGSEDWFLRAPARRTPEVSFVIIPPPIQILEYIRSKESHKANTRRTIRAFGISKRGSYQSGRRAVHNDGGLITENARLRVFLCGLVLRTS